MANRIADTFYDAEARSPQDILRGDQKQMRNRRTIFLTVIATAFLALCLPSLAVAQGGYDPYGRPDYRRGRDYGRYDQRYLRDSVHRLRDLSGRFESDLDRALDRSRVDGTRREDQLNDMARDFNRAARDLKDRFNERDLYRSQGEAQRVLELGSRLDRVAQRFAYDGRLVSEWSQIRQELRVIADAYGYRDSGYYGNDDYYRNDRYRRNDPYRRNRNAQRIGDILRRIPF